MIDWPNIIAVTLLGIGLVYIVHCEIQRRNRIREFERKRRDLNKIFGLFDEINKGLGDEFDEINKELRNGIETQKEKDKHEQP